MRNIRSKINLKWLLEVLVVAGLLLLILVTARKIAHPVNLTQLKELLLSFGFLSPLVYVLLTALTNVFPPLAAGPMWVMGILLFGFPWAYLYILVAGILGSTVNYCLARFLGRPVLRRLVGKKVLTEIDHFVGVKDLRVLFLLRLFGGSASDYLSYGAGLSSIGLVPYLIITILGTTPLMLLGLWFIGTAVSKPPAVAASFLGAYFVISNLVSLLMIPVFAYNSKHRTKKI